MKVKELIEILKELDQEKEIKHYSYSKFLYAKVEEIGEVEDDDLGVKCYMIY